MREVMFLAYYDPNHNIHFCPLPFNDNFELPFDCDKVFGVYSETHLKSCLDALQRFPFDLSD